MTRNKWKNRKEVRGVGFGRYVELGLRENGRGGGRSQLDSAELDVLEKAVRILHLRYRSCLRPLTKGRLPSVTELKELRVSAEALGVRSALLCLDRIPKGDPRRLALFAFRTFALRAELDAEALRDLDEPPPGNAWPVSSYRVGTPRLRALLEDMVEEVESLWNATNRTLYEVAIVLAPVLAQYALLGKAVGMAMEQYYARLTVRKHGRVVMAVGDEIILWDDGLEDVRELFLAEKAADEQPLGSAVRIDSMNDYSWFVSWNGTSAVDNIPSEVSVKKLLHSIGAPTARLAGLRARDKGLLMGVTVPDVRIEAEKRVLAQLQWVVDGGGKLEIKAARPQHQAISGGVGEREVISRGKRGAGGGAGAAAGGGAGGAAGAGGGGGGGGAGGALGGGGGGDDKALLKRSFAKRLESLDSGMDEPEPAHEIPYEDLVEATKNWSEDLQLGEGGSAVVYKGVGPDGELWAVKRGKKGGLTRLQDYHREIEAVSKMLHPNLVRLMGFCHENDEQVLVYEYVANGTLRQHLSPLQGDTEKGVLSFEQRIEAAVGVAEALLYLHSCKPVLVHRDVKSLNVFMDDDLQPKLGDYGNLKSIGDDESATTHTRVVGTPGYLDPQYCQTSSVSVWSDVYSFGVVMLELITAKPPVLKEADDSGERMALAKWATPAICAGNLDAVVDPNLAQAFPQQPMQAFASLAAMCVQRQPKDRPSMQEVVRRLKVIRQAAAAASVSSPPPINTRSNPSQKEMAALAKLQHTNLAAILGYAADKEDMQIAYDLPPNCTCLENYLFPEDAEGEFLPLRVRLKVAVGIAKGLTFLHSSAVVHGNLLSRNIMLDKNFTVLLTGYGLATMLSKTSTRKNLKGPDGMAKDAFDYGVVLFELLTGRRGALVADREGADGLIAWAEPRIEEYELSAACTEPTKRMVVRMLDVLAKECVQEDPRCRPTMKDLVVRLYSLQESLASQ
ncbi:unnamed protein product [Closterium sp. Yama58-4]|nr:unnamed protein product [Closterium sp. Yama58-4]